MFVDHFAARQAAEATRLVVASPDIGGVKRAQIFREMLERRLGHEVELAFIEKRRASDKVSKIAMFSQHEISPRSATVSFAA